jgi:PiT family inorganic phosphate transporter
MTFALVSDSISSGTLLLLIVALGIALAFEFVNGFHDTANAVATVIYTKALEPRKAVVWSGLCNFLGVYMGGTAVAFSIVNLLPVDLLVAIDSGQGLAMVLALLTSAIAWNLGTWYLGIPASSSHTLIGAILGVGLANSALPGHVFGSGVNWQKAGEVGLSLLLSPMVGFSLAALLLLLLKALVRNPALYQPPSPTEPPPPWIRGTLVFTCTGVSLAHGSNDGQKGIGLIMLILIGLVPAQYAINAERSPRQILRAVDDVESLKGLIRRHVAEADFAALESELDAVRQLAGGRESLDQISKRERWQVRTALLHVDKVLATAEATGSRSLTEAERHTLTSTRRQVRELIYYAPTWVLLAVAGALGTGTMVGWRRIVVTVGERIGKSHLTYAQGAAAEFVAMGTIGLADFGGLPVSTTHVLSSAVAGTMAANRSGLQWRTVRAIGLAWVLTLPASMLLSAGLFLLFRLFVSR